MLGITVPLASVPGKVAGTILSPSGTTTMLELGNSSSMNANSSSPVLPSEAWIQVSPLDLFLMCNIWIARELWLLCQILLHM